MNYNLYIADLIMADIHNIQSWLNGDRLRDSRIRKQYPLIALITVLIFVYILTGYRSAQQQHRLTDVTRPSQVSAALRANGSGLKENNVPPVKIVEK